MIWPESIERHLFDANTMYFQASFGQILKIAQFWFALGQLPKYQKKDIYGDIGQIWSHTVLSPAKRVFNSSYIGAVVVEWTSLKQFLDF